MTAGGEEIQGEGMTLTDLLKIPASERDVRLAEFMEPKPDDPGDCKSLKKWNHDDRLPDGVSCHNLDSPQGWWRLVIDFGEHNWNHVPPWKPRFDFADDALADEGELLVASFAIIKRLRDMGWLTDVKTMCDGYVVQAQNYPRNGLVQVPCEKVHEGVALVALLIASEVKA